MLRIFQWKERFSSTKIEAWVELLSEEWPSEEKIVHFVSSHNFGYYVGKEQIKDGRRIRYVIVYID
mgnify:CR=1 FL=1